MASKIGLYNKEYFLWILKQEIYRVERTNQPLSILCLEMPCLEKIIQANSYSSKKIIIDTIIEIIENNFRKTDTKGWYNSNTLAILMPNTTHVTASIAHNKLKEEIISSLKEKNIIYNNQFDNAWSIYTYPDSLLMANKLLNNEQFNKIEPENQLTGLMNSPNIFHHNIIKNFRKLKLQLVIKRLFDLIGSFILLFFLLPVMLITGIIIKLTSPGPVFFKQIRLGYCGTPFTFYKFRSMYHCTDDKRHREYVSDLIKGKHEKINMGMTENPLLKMKDDPRITCFGSFLRRSSLDELPQLFNVLKGEMSLIGPRPPIPYEVEIYQKWHLKRILDVRPGITGLWQVIGRSRTTFDDMVRLDIEYIENWSLIMDIKILFKTINAVISAKGAY